MAMVKTKKRADLVRDRRNKRGRKKPVRSHNIRNKTAMRTATPTVVRTRSMAQATGRKRSNKQARRRNYVPLGTPGAEIRMPAMPVVRVGWRLLSAAMAAGMIFTIYSLLNSPSFRVSMVEVAGLERISSQDVNSVLGVIGASIFTIQPETLLGNLKAAFPEIEDISVKVGFPGLVFVEASERQPMLIWRQDDGLVWVDVNGVAFRQRGAVEGLVTVQAIQAPPLAASEAVQDQIISAEMVQAILTLSKQAPVDTIILYDPEHGLGWQDPQGWKVYFGSSPEDMELRLTMYEVMVALFKERGIKPVLVSLEYLHAPYYRLVATE